MNHSIKEMLCNMVATNRNQAKGFKILSSFLNLYRAKKPHNRMGIKEIMMVIWAKENLIVVYMT
jgi:hypothetical protein